MSERLYEFKCDSCEYEYSKLVDWNKIQNYKPVCPMCSKETVYRNYSAERVGGNVGPKTVGMLADKNTTQRKINEEKAKQEENRAGFKVTDGRAEKI